MARDKHEVVPQLVEVIMNERCCGEEHRVEDNAHDGPCDESFMQDIDFEMTRDAQMTTGLCVNARHVPSFPLMIGDPGKLGRIGRHHGSRRCASTFPFTRGLSNLMAQAGLLACGIPALRPVPDPLPR
jgi:hypothetical protein